MGKQKLTKVEAIELLTPVVDDEVTPEEREAFMEFIAENKEVRQKYNSMKQIKNIVSSRCPNTNAPDSLHQFVKDLDQESNPLASDDDPFYDLPNSGPANNQQNPPFNNTKNSSSNPGNRYLYALAASLLIIAAVCSFYFNSAVFSDKSPYNIEEYAYKHFEKHKEGFVKPTFSTASIGSAEIELASNYNMPMNIPSLHNFEFKGIVYGDFVSGVKTPMLEYYLPSKDQYVYIFAFKINTLEKSGILNRHKEAIKACKNPADYHVRNVKGKEVVSWKWNDIWYTAISNHKGKKLASFVETLKNQAGSS